MPVSLTSPAVCATPGQDDEESEGRLEMMVMPGMKLTHSPHTPYLGAWVLFPSGGTWAAIYCVYKGPRSKQKRKHEEEENVTPKKPNEAGHTPNRRAPPWPPGPCAIGSQETEIARTYMSPHTTQIRSPCDGRLYIRAYIRRAAFEVAPPPLPRTPSVVRPDLGEKGGRRGVRVD